MITISKPGIDIKDGKARLSAMLDFDGDRHELWIEVDREYEAFLCAERSDAFVLGVIYYAMRYGHDISCEAPMTKRLYEQLTDQFLPALYKINGYRDSYQHGCGYRVRISAPLAPEVVHPEGGVAVGSGVSCGVDSLHVFAVHPEITHGCIWHAYGVVPGETQERREKAWRHLVGRAEEFCAATQKKLVVVDTNFDRQCVKSLQWDGMTTYGNLFCIFALQKMWSKYYVASGYDIGDFHLKGSVSTDPAHYEYLLFALCGLSNFSICLDGVAQNRVQKVADLVKYEPATRFLNVCHEITEDGRNCSYGCAKCMRTMLDLDACGALEMFHAVFDVQYYRTHFHEYLAEWYRGLLQRNPFATELMPYFSTRKFPLWVRLRAYRIVLRKSIKKLMRGGKTRVGKFSSRG